MVQHIVRWIESFGGCHDFLITMTYMLVIGLFSIGCAVVISIVKVLGEIALVNKCPYCNWDFDDEVEDEE